MQEMQEMQVLSLDQEDPLEKEWLPTPVFLPGKFHGQRNLAGCKELDTTEHAPFLSLTVIIHKICLKTYSFLRITRKGTLQHSERELALLHNLSFQHKHCKDVEE